MRLTAPRLLALSAALLACDDPVGPLDAGPQAPPLAPISPCPVAEGVATAQREVTLFELISAGPTRFEGRVEVKASAEANPGARLLEEIPTGPTLPLIFKLQLPQAAAPAVGEALWASLLTEAGGGAILVLGEAADRPPSLIAVRGGAAILGEDALTDRDIQIRRWGACAPVEGDCHPQVYHQGLLIDLGQGAAHVFAGQPMEIARAGRAYTIQVAMAREVEGATRCPGAPSGWYELVIDLRD
ncbi:hypothetical protein KKB55_09565 [Myxococcota bacterium]|nr:hypothetical protein [Myxococcota bacterium]MBU1897981.1 hypothetical protein [Myxococcota bacterium]